MALAYRIDRGTLRPPRKKADGTLVVEAVLTRTGVLEYRNDDGSIRREYRPDSEVFSSESLETCKLVPVTNEHPGEMVTADNFRNHIVGAVGTDVRKDGEFLIASMAIFDAKAVADVESGKQEVSCGYAIDIDETPGTTPGGERYDAIQRSIEYNHVAIVEKGRAGPLARIRMDALQMVGLEPAPLIESHIMDPEKQISALQKQIAELELDRMKQELRADTAERDLDAARKSLTSAEAQRDDAKDKLEQAEKVRKDSVDSRDSEVQKAAKLRLDAHKVLKDPEGKGFARLDGLSDKEIKIAVIEQVSSKDLPADRADDIAYIDARFDAACETYATPAGDKPDVGTLKTSREDGSDERQAMIERNRKLHLGARN